MKSHIEHESKGEKGGFFAVAGVRELPPLRIDMGRSRGNFHSNDEDPTQRFELVFLIFVAFEFFACLRWFLRINLGYIEDFGDVLRVELLLLVLSECFTFAWSGEWA